MKKIRIEALPGVIKKVTFFDCIESLYVWLNSEKKDADVPGMTVVEVTRNEFLEIEWCGCEIYYEPDGSWQRYNLVRMAKAMPNKTQNSTGTLAQIYYGWVSDSEVLFQNCSDETSFTTKLDATSECKLDFTALFQDPENGEPESSQNIEDSEIEKLLDVADEDEENDKKTK